MTITIRAAAVLLDMDGTLVDSTAVVERLWTEWAAGHGLEPATVLGLVHGRQSHASMAILLPDRPHEENLAEGARMLEPEIGDLDGIVEIPGAAALVASLASAPHGLVTSASRSLAHAQMSAAGVPMTRLAVTAEMVTTSKPDPEGFLLGAELLGVAPGECVAFEDSDSGIAAARAAGMRVVGVGVATRSRGARDADWVVPDLWAMRVVEADGAGVTLEVTELAEVVTD